MKSKQTKQWVEEFILNPLSLYLVDKKINYAFCGSYRRGAKELGDIDIIIDGNDGELWDPVHEVFNLNTKEVLWSGQSKLAVVVHNFQIDIRNIPANCWGAGLLMATGPVGFNVNMRAIAKKKGMLLNEYGLYVRADHRRLAGKTEEEVFRFLGMRYVVPEERQNPSWWKK